MRKYRRVALTFGLVILFFCASSAFAGDEPSPWSWRLDFVWIPPDSDFNPIDNLFGVSLDVLHDINRKVRVGGEIQWVTGDREDQGTDFKTDWVTLLAVAEYSILEIPGKHDFIKPSAYSYEVYANVGLGGIYVDADESSPLAESSVDDTTFAARVALGANILVYENVAFNIQGGYLWSDVDLGGVSVNAAGLEGKIGATVTY